MDAFTDAKDGIEKVFQNIERMLPKTENKFIEEIKDRIRKLEEIHKEKFSVGVLGITGAGKSSLVNAVLGNRLLPSGKIGACTSVIIELTANMENSNYEAVIEFIPRNEWDEELKVLCEAITHAAYTDRQIVTMAKSKIEALYGKDAVHKDFNALTAMENSNDMFTNGKKIISHDNVAELSKAIVRYICSQRKKDTHETCYWPLVKSVTIKVPNSEELLENIVLVDVPGTGDWNKARNKMCEQHISKLSSVWVVADINRAVSENAAWSILDKISNNLGPGGQCNRASFICTKTDNIESEDEELPVHGQFVGADKGQKRKRAQILDRNKKVKDAVKSSVDKQYENLGSIKVFTVSSVEFQKKTPTLKPEETEIPKLRALLEELNDQQSKKLAEKYIFEVFDIISTIHMMNSEDEKNEKQKSKIKSNLMSSLKQPLKGITEFLTEIWEMFNSDLTQAASTSKEECVEKAWNEVIDTKDKHKGYHSTLQAVCRNQGSFRSKNGQITNMNATLIETMRDDIKKRFEEVFPFGEMVEDKKSIYWQIDHFNILSENLKIHLSPEHLELITIQLFIVKENLKHDIVNEKKEIYHKLMSSIETFMQPAYEKAARLKGDRCTKKLQDILMQHIEKEKDTMFLLAKDSMLESLDKLKKHIIKELQDELLNTLMKPLDTQKNTLPDISEFYERMRRHVDQLTDIQRQQQQQ